MSKSILKASFVPTFLQPFRLVLLGLVLCIFVPTTSVASLPRYFEYSRAQISEDELQKLFELGKYSNINELLAETRLRFPHLKIIVLPSSKSEINSFRAQGRITFRHPGVSSRQYDWYLNRKDSFLDTSSLAIFLPAGTEHWKYSQRPLSQRHVIVLRDLADRATIFHELVHFLIANSDPGVAVAEQNRIASWFQNFQDKIQPLLQQQTKMQSENEIKRVLQSIEGILFNIRYRLGEEIDTYFFVYSHSREFYLTSRGSKNQKDLFWAHIVETDGNVRMWLAIIGDLRRLVSFKNLNSQQSHSLRRRMKAIESQVEEIHQLNDKYIRLYYNF